MRKRTSWSAVAVVLALTLVAASQAQADLIRYVADLNGPSESPPNTSQGTGAAAVDFDSVAQTLQVQVTFSDLTTGTTASHIHAPTGTPLTGTVGVATTVPTFPGFPLGVTSGTYDQTFDLTLSSSYNPAFVAAHGGTAASAEAALTAALAAGEAYLNIHTSEFPNGEIRGFLIPAASVPEPTSLVMSMTALLAGLGCWRRRHHHAV